MTDLNRVKVLMSQLDVLGRNMEFVSRHGTTGLRQVLGAATGPGSCDSDLGAHT